MNALTSFPRLYRLDVAVVTFGAALAGPYFSTGSFSATDVAVAAFISLILYNYVYVLNAVTDRFEDTISHPERPLPSGRIGPTPAAFYLIMLLHLAVAGSIVLFTGPSLFLALLVVFLGTLYSAAPFELKNHPVIAIAVTAWGMAHPFFITAHPSRAPLGAVLILVALGVVAFKDIGDPGGDAAAGRRSILAVLSLRTLCVLSLFSFIAAATALILLDLPILLALPALTGATLLYHLARGPLEKSLPLLYTRLIRSALAAIVGIIIVVVAGLIGAGGA
ncbi:MAG TPA: UbiA family prenyltransferase [bacterium]|nr:UbiA family prenyltransferase [bacterium]